MRAREDAFPGLLEDMARAWAGRRPPLPFDLARGIAILRDGPRTMLDDPYAGSRNLGVPMTDIVGMLERA